MEKINCVEYKIPEWMNKYLPYLDTIPEKYKNQEIFKNDVRAALIYGCNSQVKLLISLKEAGFLS